MASTVFDRCYFEGWYYKHQVNAGATGIGKSLAVIPGRAADSAFVWVITDSTSHHISYPLAAYHSAEGGVRVGNNTFSQTGISLDTQTPELTLTGEVRYTSPTPICGDIMGPFRFFPMECRHGIISMRHALQGALTLNGDVQDFSGGNGYIESDSGRSFPDEYTWVQCNAFEADCAIMASVARIPFYGLRFWGCICVVWLNGQEYRLATYNGVKIQCCERGKLVLKQGKYTLHIAIDGQAGQLLPAPALGKMRRFIRETLSCPAQFRFMEGDNCLFEGKSNYASYEYMMKH